MPFPPIEHCFLCDDVRPEPGNKATILGFYGVLPKVGIIVLPEEETVKLTFFVMTGRGTGQHVLRPHLYNPDNTHLMTANPTLVIVTPEATGTAFAFTFAGIRFVQDGQHSVRLEADERTVYTSTFLVQRGEIPKF